MPNKIANALFLLCSSLNFVLIELINDTISKTRGMRWEDLITEKEMYIAYRKVLMYNLLKYTSDSANVINLIIDYAVHPTTKANNLPIFKKGIGDGY